MKKVLPPPPPWRWQGKGFYIPSAEGRRIGSLAAIPTEERKRKAILGLIKRSR